MPKLNEFEIKLAETIQNSGATKGAGATIDEMMSSMGLEGTEENVAKVSEALRNLKKQWYVYEIPAVHSGMPDEYFTTNKYQQEREVWWGGTKYGRKVTRELKD